jgi:hypothetical protein
VGTPKSICSIPDCGRLVHGHGWCKLHYDRWEHHQSPYWEPQPLSPEKRFWAKVNKDGPIPELRPDLGPCWVWIGAKSRGYAHLKVNGRVHKGHRWAYEHFIGLIPEGLEPDHLCRNRGCVNPAHLEPVPHKENSLRGISFAAENAAKTHCPKGHPYDLFNTWRGRSGKRFCRMCASAREAQRKMGTP